MKTAIISCPFMGIGCLPHYTLGFLSSLLKQRNHEVVTFDFSKQLYMDAGQVYKDLFLWGYFPTFLMDKKLMAKTIENNRHLIESYVDRILETKADIIGFSIIDSTQLISMEFVRLIKQKAPEKTIILGGLAFVNRERAYDIMRNNKNVDYVFIGYADNSLPEFLDMMKSGSDISKCKGILFRKGNDIHYTGDAEYGKNLDKLPIPDFDDLMPLYKNESKIVLPLLGSRGCTRACLFCTSERKHVSMSPERRVAEIVHQYKKYNINEFFFSDNAIDANLRELERFCELMIELKSEAANGAEENKGLASITWQALCFIRPELTPEFLAKMAKAGCTKLSFGIESASDEILKKMNKGFKISVARKVIEDTYKAGITTSIFFILGYPGETDEDFRKSLEFTKAVSPFLHDIGFFAFTIPPDSDLYKRADEFEIVDKDSAYLWYSKDGKNTLENRVEKFETFFKLALELNLINHILPYKPSESQRKKDLENIIKQETIYRYPDKWFQLSRYYESTGDSAKQRDCMDRSGLIISGII
ncbi:MAG: B12-binding domain-containing radical SAM protein [Endomicrobiales bacterium]|nr:B12-binding domain-containing radical SAM protein [Endomicrobiales bacterium]